MHCQKGTFRPIAVGLRGHLRMSSHSKPVKGIYFATRFVVADGACNGVRLRLRLAMSFMRQTFYFGKA